MSNSKDNLQKGDFNQSKKNQKQAQNNLKKFAGSLGDMKEKMQKNDMKEAIRQMRKAISDMLELSENQEKLKQKTKSLDYNSTQFQELLNEQANVNQALANTINNLVELSQKSFAVTPEMGAQLGDALKNMNETLDQLSERNTGSAWPGAT